MSSSTQPTWLDALERIINSGEFRVIVIVGVLAILAISAAHWKKLKRLPGWITYGVPVFIRWYAHTPIISRTCSLLLGALFFVYEVFGDKPFIVEMQPWFSWLIWFLFVLVLSAAIAESLAPKEDNRVEQCFMMFISSVGAIVKAKAGRLTQTVLPRVLSGENRDDVFVDPLEQIQSIFRIGSEFLHHAYGIDPKRMDITILAREPQFQNWRFLDFKHHDRTHTPAEEIIGNHNSLAARCLKSNRQEFIASKKIAAEDGGYHLSDQDNDLGGDGSAFCLPFKLEHGKRSWIYLVTITTYGQPLCNYRAKSACDATERFLGEICERIRIELINRIIRNIRIPHAKNTQNKQKRNRSKQPKRSQKPKQPTCEPATSSIRERDEDKSTVA